MSALSRISTLTIFGAFLSAFAFQAAAQALPYGMRIGIENAKKVSAAALVEARKINTTQAVAITDPAGRLIYFETMDDNQTAAFDAAMGKARTAAMYRRPTQAFQDDLAGGGNGLRILTLPGVVAAGGGIPLVIDGKIVGAIGISGGTFAQDQQVAGAGAAALK